MYQINLSLPEIIALIGLIQCTFLIVHIAFRSGQIKKARLVLLYFVILGFAFTTDLMQNQIIIKGQMYFYLQWALWFLGPPLSVLMIIKLADLNKAPSLQDFWVLLLIPIGFALSMLSAKTFLECTSLQPCPELNDTLLIMGLMAGAISLLVIFSKKDLLKNITKQKFGQERYWLIVSLIILNLGFLGATLIMLSNLITAPAYIALRNLLGIGFVYLVSTSLLRVFPQTKISPQHSATAEDLSNEERELAKKIQSLLKLEKIYHEPTYSRADLARECDVSEMMISRVINLHFQKSFPQLINEHRIEDAKRLLTQTDASIQIIAHDVGFNSLPSFNRVFKEMSGYAPGQYRKNNA